MVGAVDKERDHRLASLAGMTQRRVIREPEISLKPEDDGLVAGHLNAPGER